jgi:hypothetical protein
VHPVGKGIVKPYRIRRADSGKINRYTRGVIKIVGVA